MFPPLIMLALDTDGDGIISAQEITNASDSLKKLDTNGDGQLTPDEYLGLPGEGRKHHEKGNPETSGTSGASDVEASSTSSDSGMGHKMDAPGNKSSGKRHHGPPPWQLVEALDANGDGVISADEIANAPAALKTLDKNSDGQLGPVEYGPKPRPLPKELESYDKNGDGKLDLAEMQAVIADIKSGKLKPPQPPHQQPPPDDSESCPQ